VRVDIENLKAAAKSAGVSQDRLFMPVTSPNGVGINEYYKTEEEYLFALADALNKECKVVVDAGLLVQLDDPFITDVFVMPSLDRAQMERRAALHVEVNNAALKGVPWEKIRFHTCYGINQGPRIYEATLADVLPHVLRINAGSYSFEAANPRHEHEYHVFESVKVPEGKVICPGVVTHASNIVEHPQLIAEWLVRFAKLVGRENVMAGADCGFSSQALYRTEVHETVIWEKFKAMRQGADIATKILWN
jgi:5-methyltetrahydropteroyltriglutamate--homocysteine methyltransferase